MDGTEHLASATPVEPAAPTKPAAPVEPAAPTNPAAPVEPAAPPEPSAPIVRDTALICLGLTLGAWLVWPRTLAAAGGVLGGGLLIALSAWAIRGAVDGLLTAPAVRPSCRRLSLVKTFTRHAILALAAYGMMARLRVDPVALLIGVTSLGVAVAVEAIRVVTGRRTRPNC